MPIPGLDWHPGSQCDRGSWLASVFDFGGANAHDRLVTAANAEVLGEELHEFGVDLFRARPSQPVGCSLDLNVLDPLDHFRLPSRCCIRRQNSVVVAMY